MSKIYSLNDYKKRKKEKEDEKTCPDKILEYIRETAIQKKVPLSTIMLEGGYTLTDPAIEDLMKVSLIEMADTIIENASNTTISSIHILEWIRQYINVLEINAGI
jgi:hypothetical protein